jgi:anti-sigma-K factor RskA
MNCDKVQQNLVEYVLGDLRESDIAAIEAHLQDECAACEHELSDVRDGIEAVYARPSEIKLETQEIRRIQNTVKELIHSRSQVTASPEFQKPALWSLSHMALYAASVAAGLLIALLIGPLENWTSSNSGNRLANSGASTASVPFDQEEPRVVLTSLKNPNTLGNPTFRVLYDEMNQELHLYCGDLAPPARNTHYELFTLDANGAKRSLGTLEVHPEGNAQMVVDGLSKYNVTTLTIETIEDYSQL